MTMTRRRRRWDRRRRWTTSPWLGRARLRSRRSSFPMAAEYEAGLVGSKRPLVDEEYAGDDDTGKRIKRDDGVEEEGLTAAQRNALTGLNAEPNARGCNGSKL